MESNGCCDQTPGSIRLYTRAQSLFRDLAMAPADGSLRSVLARSRRPLEWEEIWPGPAMKLVGLLAARSPGLRLALAFEIERYCSADEILQGRLIDLAAFVDVDGAPGIPVEAGVE